MARKAWLISADMPKDFRDTKQNSRKMKRVRKQQLKKGAKWKYGMTHAKDRIAKSGVRMDARPGEVKVIYSKDLGIDLREE